MSIYIVVGRIRGVYALKNFDKRSIHRGKLIVPCARIC